MRDRIRATSAREDGPAEPSKPPGSTYSSVLLRGAQDTGPKTHGIPARSEDHR